MHKVENFRVSVMIYIKFKFYVLYVDCLMSHFYVILSFSMLFAYAFLSSAAEKFLLFAKKQEIRGVHLEYPYINIMTAMTVPNVYAPLALDYDEKNERIYWTDDSLSNEQLGLHSNGIEGNTFETLDSGLYFLTIIIMFGGM